MARCSNCLMSKRYLGTESARDIFAANVKRDDAMLFRDGILTERKRQPSTGEGQIHVRRRVGFLKKKTASGR